MRTPYLLAAGALLCGGCLTKVSADADELESPGRPQVELDPSRGIIPLPNNLGLKDPDTGALELPEQCHESNDIRALREDVLMALDGFGTFEPSLRVTTTAPVAAQTIAEHVLVFRRAADGVAVAPEDAELVPARGVAREAVRYDADCASEEHVPTLEVVPEEPLRERSTYVVALLPGIETAGGESLAASATWGLVRQTRAPVVVRGEGDDAELVRNDTPLDPVADREALLGLAALWEHYAPTLDWLEAAAQAQGVALAREDLLIAWELDTQTVAAPLDPTVSGSPAAVVAASSTTVANLDTTTDPAEIALEVVDWTDTGDACEQVPCAAIGAVVRGELQSPRFQPLVGTYQVPGRWDHPLTPSQEGTDTLPFLAFTPDAGTFPAPWPLVVFGHGLTRRKEDLYALAGQLAEDGLASIAIDWVAHGSRAVRVLPTSILCPSGADPTQESYCFAQLTTSDLAVTRDNVRQSVLDLHKLVAVAKTCTAGACGPLEVDPTRIAFVGQSLGALIGATAVATSSDLAVAVLNVGGIGWVDVMTGSETEVIYCPIVDSLIDAGVLEGEKWLSFGSDPLCREDSWRDDPRFLSFTHTARWVLDPAEPGNFVPTLRGGHAVLVQEVIGDQTVPNTATDALGFALGLAPTTAAVPSSTSPGPTAIADDVGSAWIRYGSNAGAAYWHGSLLLPESGVSGERGTAQMQQDALTFLLANL